MKTSSTAVAEIGDLLPNEPAFVRFLDTIWADRTGPHDDLETREQAGVWFGRVMQADFDELTEEEAARTRQLRNSLRRLAARHTGDTRARAESPVPIEEAIDIINSYAELPVPGPRIYLTKTDKIGLGPSGTQTFEQILAVLARESIEAMTGKDRQPPVRACMAPACVLYYVQDHPRRAWCSPTCGNRARAARHYARHRPTR